MNAANAEIRSQKRHFSPIWIVPVAAIVLGLWLVVDNYISQGPTIEIRFPSASGIEANKTDVRVLSVKVGLVTGVRISEDLSGVIVTAKLDPVARQFLREDSEFWVVRPNVRGLNVSGLSTILSGAYIELSPGVDARASKSDFAGLDSPPTTPTGTPGIRLNLTSETSASLDAGSPVLYRGFRVGNVESADLDLDRKLIRHSIFIDAPYDDLVSTNTRFWDVSGISAELNTEGVRLSIGSLQALLEGGVSFGLPKNTEPGGPVAELSEFRLYPNEIRAHEDPFRHSAEYVVSFEQSLRGLRPGAPVTYRGLRIGNVERIMSLSLMDLSEDLIGVKRGIPVLISVEPGRLNLDDSSEGVRQIQEIVEIAVSKGLRATLEPGNLLTGSLYVGLDFDETAEPMTMGTFNQYQTLPSTSSGIGLMQVQINQLLAKINALPLEQTTDSARLALDELRSTLATVRSMLEDDDMQQIGTTIDVALDNLTNFLQSYSTDSEFSVELNDVMRELRFALESFQDVTDRLGDNPNQLLFPSDPTDDPEPKAADK